MPDDIGPRYTAVATVVTPSERLPLDAAGEGTYRTLHRESVQDVISDLRANRASAVVVSAARCDERERRTMAAMLREFPRVPTVLLLSHVSEASPQSMLLLGQSGVKQVVDVRLPSGWRDLRNVLQTGLGYGIQRQALADIAADLSGATHDCWRFFEALFLVSPRICTVRALAVELRVHPSSLMSRFFRARLPTPKQYLTMARLVRAARLFENPGFSIANVANHMDYSSPQSFGRHVRLLMGMTALEFRIRHDGSSMLRAFREQLVLPHLANLKGLRPLSAVPPWLPQTTMRPPDPLDPASSADATGSPW